MKPEENEYAPFYKDYVEKAGDGNILSILEKQMGSTASLFKSIPEERGIFSYAEGKWTIKKLASHMADGERVFGYRAMRIARNDKTDLPGFEQDDYVRESNANARSLAVIASELYHIRKSNLLLFESFSEDELKRTGTANGFAVSVRALLYIIAGHEKHHIEVIKNKYL